MFMSGPDSPLQAPRFGDVAHLGHLELLTPRFDESLAFFTSIVGLHESGRAGHSVYLRGWGDYEWHTLKLTASATSGLGHIGLRVRDQATLDALVKRLNTNQVAGQWIEDPIHGPAFRCQTPDGHAVELYSVTRRFVASPDVSTAFKNQPQRYVPRGIAPRRLDHINLMASDVSPTRRFFHELLGLRLTEQIIFDGGVEMGAWLSATNKSYDIAITRDRSGAKGRLHHFTYVMDSREDVLRAADVLRDASVRIETGPHKHSIGQTFFLYCIEPGGNRFEIGAGGYLILDPDWKPVVWTQAERAQGQAWGLQTTPEFHSYGTPPAPLPDSTTKKAGE
jgi:catechol 2,3-dioxygenase